MTKTREIGGYTFILPFVARGYWVEDASGLTVAEARDKAVAIDLAKLLNAA